MGLQANAAPKAILLPLGDRNLGLLASCWINAARRIPMKPILIWLTFLMFPLVASAGVGRGESAKQEDACEQARTKAEATCKGGQAKSLGKCECVERATTLYLKNWRCAVQATCESDSVDSSEEHSQEQD